uniref:Putative odorant binding protein OBP11 n=1 Tax=Spodoptera litura TaxID=69820 RepID=A0A0N7I630_SPOLT
MSFSSPVWFAVLQVCIGAVCADKRPYNKEAIFECIEKFDIPMTEKGAFENNDVSSVDPCFWACSFKTIGFLNSEGQYDPEVTHTRYKKEDLAFLGEAKFNKFEEIVVKCDAALEKITGTDSKAECDRGLQLAKCYIEDMRNLILDDSRK